MVALQTRKIEPTGSSGAAIPVPLAVDLDGTLLRSDMLLETFFALLSASPWRALVSVAALRHGRAALKAEIAAHADIDIASLPWNAGVIEVIRAARAEGRPVYLASATDRRLVTAIAAHLGLFDGVLGSDGRTNLSGGNKAAALCEAFGDGGFDYAGNGAPDLAVFERARRVIVVDPSRQLRTQTLARWPAAQVVQSGPVTLRHYLRTVRAHQWLKNLLLFVPMLAAHRFDLLSVLTCTLAFVSFSLCASGVYVLNDLLDLRHDRVHPTKCRRGFAAGTVPILHGVVLTPLLLVAAVGSALAVGSAFTAVLLAYYVVTIAYSTWLKRLMMVDVVTLACLYGLRLMAGAAAVGVPLSPWLGLFALFLFTMLATVKRCTELIDRSAAGRGDPAGRGYRLGDMPMLSGFAAASGLTATLVLALYVNSEAVTNLYARPEWLAGICVLCVYWIGRLLLLTTRGEMHDDPVVFAITDRVSLGCAAVALVLFVVALA